MPAVPKSAGEVALTTAAVDEPWTAGLSPNAIPWSAESHKWTDSYKSAGHDEIPDAAAKQWFTAINGHSFSLTSELIGKPLRRIGRFDGTAKLRAPWPNDAVWRMTPFDVTDLMLTFWNGSAGVLFQYYPRHEPPIWAAFEVTRNESAVGVVRVGLLTTDNGSCGRSTAGTFDIRHQDQQIVLARGGIILIAAPLAHPPQDVIVGGQFRLRGMSMHRSESLSVAPLPRHHVLSSGPVSKLRWRQRHDHVKSLETSFSLTSNSFVEPEESVLPVARCLEQSPDRGTGLLELIVKISAADPGTGISICDRNAKSLLRVDFRRDLVTNQTVFAVSSTGHNQSDIETNLRNGPPHFFRPGSWFKFVVGQGTAHLHIGSDGLHWGRLSQFVNGNGSAALDSLKVQVDPGGDTRTICLSDLQIRELSGIIELTKPELYLRAASDVQPFDFERWKQQVRERLPTGVDPIDWSIASAVVALQHANEKSVALPILQTLLDTVERSAISFTQKKRLLDDACLLVDLLDDESTREMRRRYEDLGWQLERSGDHESITKVRLALLQSPFWSAGEIRFACERLHSHQIIDAVYRQDWPLAWASSRTVSFWNTLPHPDFRPIESGGELDRHAMWGESLAVDFVPQLDDGTTTVLPVNLRHPFIPAISKDAYNWFAELRSALSGGSEEDACRIAMSIAPQSEQELLTDAEDPELFVSVATAIDSARKSYPAFAEMMNAKFASHGQLRLRSAIQRKDLQGVRAIGIQFAGTSAARDGQMWLGDRELAIGHFDTAEQHFRDALVEANPGERQILEPRLGLARSLGGQNDEKPFRAALSQSNTDGIKINGTSVTGEEIRVMTKDLANRPMPNGVLRDSTSTARIDLEQGNSQLIRRAEFDGHPGLNSERWEFRFGDPFGRQLAVASDERRIYVSNRFQVNSYSIETAQQI